MCPVKILLLNTWAPSGNFNPILVSCFLPVMFFTYCVFTCPTTTNTIEVYHKTWSLSVCKHFCTKCVAVSISRQWLCALFSFLSCVDLIDQLNMFASCNQAVQNQWSDHALSTVCQISTISGCMQNTIKWNQAISHSTIASWQILHSKEFPDS